jgi:hypothetical protein
VNELPPELADEAQRRLRATRALDMRNNRYGAASAYIAWALEILLELDPLDTAVLLADGATLDSVLAPHVPVAEADLDRLRAEVRQMYAGLEATADPSRRSVEAVHNIGLALSLIEQTLLPE